MRNPFYTNVNEWKIAWGVFEHAANMPYAESDALSLCFYIFHYGEAVATFHRKALACKLSYTHRIVTYNCLENFEFSINKARETIINGSI